MDKKIMIITFSAILIITLIFTSFNKSDSEKTGCDWKPPKGYVGPCPMNAGWYFNGNGCVSLGACINEKNYELVKKGIPFNTAEECLIACPKEEPESNPR